jgi:hypothetical protein
MMGALYGMKGEMTASRVESKRQFKAQQQLQLPAFRQKLGIKNYLRTSHPLVKKQTFLFFPYRKIPDYVYQLSVHFCQRPGCRYCQHHWRSRHSNPPQHFPP